MSHHRLPRFAPACAKAWRRSPGVSTSAAYWRTLLRSSSSLRNCSPTVAGGGGAGASPLRRGPRTPGPHRAILRCLEQAGKADPESVRQAHHAAHRKVLHSQLDTLQIVCLESEPLREGLLRPPALASELGNSAADVLESTIGVELPHAPTVDLRLDLKHCVL
jgi:hypothetical protein